MSAGIYYRQPNERDVLVSILPGCEIGGAVELARLCTQWDALWISMVGSSPITRSQRWQYPTGIFTAYYRMPDAAELFTQLLNKFNWTSVNIIIDNSSPAFYAELGALVVTHLKDERHIRYTVWTIYAQSGLPFADFPSILEKIRATSRVVLYFGLGPTLREFLFTASSMEMTNGEYVYVLVENNLFRPINWQAGDRNDSIILQAFRSVLMINPSENKNSSFAKMQLGEEILRRTERDFNFTYPLHSQPYILIVSGYTTIFALAKLERMESVNVCQFFGLAITASPSGVYFISAVMESSSVYSFFLSTIPWENQCPNLLGG
ncbi:uncharacterized protein LOC129596724 [Paramacrobiotus metropolitanus]|uniref:uncharacterized protein LOC129596724 n=1 Tax=Paramacrobiotus metropolitanus TaxID=2943436 RepID=UPI002446422D|nr:uncharacterized protein LOC129596724 [Paramacrobiotus metropolitanus]